SSVNRAAAFGTILGHAKGLTIRAFFGDFENVRNDFAGALDQDGVADLQTQTVDFVHIVECGTADSDAANLHGFEDRDRCERAGTPDLHANVVDDGGLLTSRIFVGNGPARSFRCESQFVLDAYGIDLDDHAIDFVGEILAFGLPGVA